MQVSDELDSEGLSVEARSAKDGAWFDVADFLSHRISETGDLEVKVRFAGFGPEENEWVDVRKHVRLQSIPCEPSECDSICPGDYILCFKEDKGQSLHFDALVLDAQRHTHDMNECFCTFLVRYEHDQSEEETSLTNICRRTEANKSLQMLHTSVLTKQVDQMKSQNTKQADATSNEPLMIIQQSVSLSQPSCRLGTEAYQRMMCASGSTDTFLVRTAEDVRDGRGSEVEKGHIDVQDVNSLMLENEDASGKDRFKGHFLPFSDDKDEFVGHLLSVEGNTPHSSPGMGAVMGSFAALHDLPSLSVDDGSMGLGGKYDWVLAKLKAEELKGGALYPVLTKM